MLISTMHGHSTEYVKAKPVVSYVKHPEILEGIGR